MNLTDDQKDALRHVMSFMYDPDKIFYALSGKAGSGKSTLVKYIMNNINKEHNIMNIMTGTKLSQTVALTAATNDAATILSDSSGFNATTLHKFFGFRMQKDYTTGKLRLITSFANTISNTLVVVDEASQLKQEELDAITSLCIGRNTKVLFVGDKYQLNAVGNSANVFELFEVYHLTSNIRQSGLMKNGCISDIEQLYYLYRDAVITGKLITPPKVNTENIKYVNGEELKAIISSEFKNKDSLYTNTRIATYTNERTKEYNKYIMQLNNKKDLYENNDVLISVTTITSNETVVVKTNGVVVLTSNAMKSSLEGLQGYSVTGKDLRTGIHFSGFIPDEPKRMKRVLNKLIKAKKFREFFALQDTILNLAPKYSSTVHKLQGSTLNTVIIDADDIYSCRDADTVNRLMNVAISRATHKVIIYGAP